MSLFLRHLLWTTLCPGTVTILIPLFILPRNQVIDQMGWHQWGGIVLIGIGAGILLSCIYMFGKFGKGTLSPFDPARHLVIKGLYKYVRNPMYVGVMIILSGEAIFFWSRTFLIYAVIVFILFNVFIILYEEPYLKKEFGEQYDRYCKHVGRWLPGKPYAHHVTMKNTKEIDEDQ
ncbi:MAG TPA: isoprenylcysteine carboxylmethyltransferase family protein [Saprospiraceae bacterium]|nr:isoprenylcysteine carboxylmethyltransferase family protein [Saprospiraceae bacterium]